jgi:hypothetical protein
MPRLIDQIGLLARRLLEDQIRAPRRLLQEAGEEPVSSSETQDPTMPRRRVRSSTTSRARTPTRAPGTYGEPVYVWAFRSSQARGGQIITYETRLEENGDLRCNCPGWIFCKVEKDSAGNPTSVKFCKHTASIKEEAPVILASYRAGETLPVLEPLAGAIPVNTAGMYTGRLSSNAPNISNAPKTLSEGSNIRRGRVIDFD